MPFYFCENICLQSTQTNSNLDDSGWISLNNEWGCNYRIKNGWLSVVINSNLTSDLSLGRRLIGTIPLAQYGYSSCINAIVPASLNSGYMLISFVSIGSVQFDVTNSVKYHYATISIPLGR